MSMSYQKGELIKRSRDFYSLLDDLTPLNESRF
jgi:hypothetical protein